MKKGQLTEVHQLLVQRRHQRLSRQCEREGAAARTWQSRAVSDDTMHERKKATTPHATQHTHCSPYVLSVCVCACGRVSLSLCCWCRCARISQSALTPLCAPSARGM